jgi:hypothetical protein
MISVEEARARILADLQQTSAPREDGEKMPLVAGPSKIGVAKSQLGRVA